MVAPMVMPRSSVTMLDSSFCAALFSRSRTPLSLIRLPNIRSPISGALMGAMMAAITVTRMGKRIMAVLLTFFSLNSILIWRSLFVVSARMTGGWMIATSAI